MTAIETLVDRFERGTLTRRELVAALAGLVTAGTGGGAAAQPSQVVQGRTLNHVSLAVSDVAKSAEFYSKLLGLQVVSKPGNGGINLGLGSSFLGLYKIAEPGRAHHFCIGVDEYDPDKLADRLKQAGLAPRVDRNPANRTSGGDQLYFSDPDNTLVQLSANGYQG